MRSTRSGVAGRRPARVELIVPLGVSRAVARPSSGRPTLRTLKKPVTGRRVHAQGQRDAGDDSRGAGELVLGRVAPIP